MEQWLNDTLKDAEVDMVPEQLVKLDRKNPLSKNGIDRMCLTNAGIPNDEVNHLYRALFVYSVGFYNLVKEILNK